MLFRGTFPRLKSNFFYNIKFGYSNKGMNMKHWYFYNGLGDLVTIQKIESGYALVLVDQDGASLGHYGTVSEALHGAREHSEN